MESEAHTESAGAKSGFRRTLGYAEVGVFLPISRAQRTSEDDGLATTKGPGVEEKAMDHHLREIADCLDEVLRLQSRVMELTEQVSEAAGMNPGDRTLRGKVTGLFFGVQAYLEELNRLAKDTA